MTTLRETPTNIGIKIGNEMHKDGVDAVADALIRIMETRADQKTIRDAIKAFSTLSEIKSVTVQDVTINNSSPEPKRSIFDDVVHKTAWGSPAPDPDEEDDRADH